MEAKKRQSHWHYIVYTTYAPDHDHESFHKTEIIRPIIIHTAEPVAI